MALLGMQDVSVGFGGYPLLEHMNFQIEPGERICLLGRNGVGKSTLIKLICGELEPESGVISKAPSSFHHLPDADRSRRPERNSIRCGI